MAPGHREGDGDHAGQPARGDGDNALVEQAGLEFAATTNVPAPWLLAIELSADPVALLTELLPGSSAIPVEPRPAWLPALGAAAAVLHAVAVPPAAGLPARDQPIGPVDFDQLRASAPRQDLLVRAEQARRDHRPLSADGFTHGDLWTNSPPSSIGKRRRRTSGVDLGSSRSRRGDVLGSTRRPTCWPDGRRSGRRADDVADRDVVVALSTPPDVGTVRRHHQLPGRPDLTREPLEERRNRFLATALDDPEHAGGCPPIGDAPDPCRGQERMPVGDRTPVVPAMPNVDASGGCCKSTLSLRLEATAAPWTTSTGLIHDVAGLVPRGDDVGRLRGVGAGRAEGRRACPPSATVDAAGARR